MQHLDEGTIHAWLDGALPTAEAREVEQHVAVCAECAAMVAEARGFIAGASRIVSSLDVVRGNVIPKRPAGGAARSLWHSLHLTPARAALAATLMIAVSTLLTVRHDTTEKMAVSPSSVAAPARQTAAPQVKEKDRAESVRKPKEEMKAVAAMDAINRRVDSARVDAAAKPAVVAAAPPVAPAPIPLAGAAANSVDASVKKTLAKAAEVDSVRSNRVELRRAAPAFAAARNSVVGSGMTCFQFMEPQASGVPQRFALQALAQDTSQRIVRAVDENGRLDTVITGSSWTRMTPTEITVSFASNREPVTLPIRNAAFADARQEASRQAGPSVTRVLCRP